MATAVSELADAIRGLALAPARDPFLTDRVSVSSWVRVDPPSSFEPGSREAPGPAVATRPSSLISLRCQGSGPSDATPAARASRVAGHCVLSWTVCRFLRLFCLALPIACTFACLAPPLLHPSGSLPTHAIGRWPAFASIAEASVYCEAAGFALPPLQSR